MEHQQKPRRPTSWQGAKQSHNNMKRSISHPLTLAHVKEVSPKSITLGNDTHSTTSIPIKLFRTHINSQMQAYRNSEMEAVKLMYKNTKPVYKLVYGNNRIPTEKEYKSITHYVYPGQTYHYNLNESTNA